MKKIIKSALKRNSSRFIRSKVKRRKSMRIKRRLRLKGKILPHVSYVVGIPYVNRLDLLQKAVKSLKPLWGDTFVIDNSPASTLREQSLPVKVFQAQVPLSFSQSLNLLFQKAEEKKAKVAIFMHNDGEAAIGTPKALLARIQFLQRHNRNWGAIFTNYHTLVAFNMKAVKAVGQWDENLPRYFADNDYYRRLKLAGFELVESGLPVIHHHGGSSTILADAYLNYVNGVTFPIYKLYYEAKWGGAPGAETFTNPFNV